MSTEITDSSIERKVLYFEGDDSIARGLIDGQTGALDALYGKYAGYIRSVLTRVFGSADSELPDVLQDVFTSAFFAARGIKDPSSLKTWLTRIAMNKAIDCIRKRKSGSWLRFFSPDTLPEMQFSRTGASIMEDAEAMKAVYGILDVMPPRERVPFTLKRVEKMTLPQIAEVCDLSVATVKRRIASAQRRFESLASNYPELEDWLDQHGKWRMS